MARFNRTVGQYNWTLGQNNDTGDQYNRTVLWLTEPLYGTIDLLGRDTRAHFEKELLTSRRTQHAFYFGRKVICFQVPDGKYTKVTIHGQAVAQVQLQSLTACCYSNCE